MASFDWHSDPISRDTPVTAGFKVTQNVRRFLMAECGESIFDRAFRAWVMDGTARSMGDLADELKRQTRK